MSIMYDATESEPDTVKLNSKAKWATAYIESPEGYDVADIELDTVVLKTDNAEVPAETDPKYNFVSDPSHHLIDHDEDGIIERKVKFHTAEVQSILEEGEQTITIAGQVADVKFEGSNTIKVI